MPKTTDSAVPAGSDAGIERDRPDKNADVIVLTKPPYQGKRHRLTGKYAML
jgi:hypothetical protein